MYVLSDLIYKAIKTYYTYIYIYIHTYIYINIYTMVIHIDHMSVDKHMFKMIQYMF